MYGTQINNPGVFEKVVNFAAESLKDIAFDILVFRGFSGALVGPTVALRVGKPWALVRKPGDTAHSCRHVEGKAEGRYVIIDDFIDSGETVLAIQQTIAEEFERSMEASRIVYDSCPPVLDLLEKKKPECVGVVLYEESWLNKVPEDQRYYEEKLNGIKVLNWKDRAPEQELRPVSNFEQQSQAVGRLDRMFKPAYFDMETVSFGEFQIGSKGECNITVKRPLEEEIAF